MSKHYECPVCKQYDFTLDGDETTERCTHCGRKYDINQQKNPNLNNGRNELSLNEFILDYKEKIKNNPNYDFLESTYVPTPHYCPVCGKYEFEDFDSFDICPFCGWQDDGSDIDAPNIAFGANDLSFIEHKNKYLKLLKNDPNYKWSKKSHK